MWFKILILVLFAVIAQHAYKVVKTLGIHKVIYSHSPGPCRLVDGVEQGSEDIQTLPNGLAFITSGLRLGHHGQSETNKKFEGKIYLFDFNKPKQNPVSLKIERGQFSLQDLNPHGLSLWQDKSSGKVSLFIVNHNYDAGYAVDTVEKFEFDGKNLALKHVKTFRDEAMRHLNDLVATGPGTFYVTNYEYSVSTAGQILEGYLMLQWCNILYYDGAKAKVVADQMQRPNGINISPDGKYVYVAHIANQEVRVYTRNTDNSLSLKQQFPVYTFLDNIDVDPDTGDLWGGCHPVGWKVLKYLDEPNYPAPSQVLRLKVKDGLINDVQEVYADDGKMLYGSTVANYYKGAMLIGTVGHKLAYCQVKHLS